LLLVTVTPVALAAVGLVHPRSLNPATAAMWADMHVWLLPVFPLVTLGFIVPLWTRPGRNLAGTATIAAWLFAFGYACFYTGLDAVAGIGAGTAARSVAPGTNLGPVVTPLFHAGDRLGHWGAYAFIAASVAATVALATTAGWRAVPGGVVLVVAGYSFIDSHIFYPRGVLTMLGFALGFALLAWASRHPRRRVQSGEPVQRLAVRAGPG
ncbi:MAG: hypothetical protein J2P15_24595, partial [Micromonosporaceae bacterium]|nr:hypothetical protein [Micromonosporaceae bacterium]